MNKESSQAMTSSGQARDLVNFLMPPLVPSRNPRYVLAASPLQHQNALHKRTLPKPYRQPSSSRWSVRLSCLRLVITTPLYPIPERLGEACKDNGVNGTNTCASEEGSDGVPGHEKINGDGVAFFMPHGLRMFATEQTSRRSSE